MADEDTNFELFREFCEKTIEESVNSVSESDLNSFVNVCEEIIENALTTNIIEVGEALQIGNGNRENNQRFSIISEQQRQIKKFNIIGKKISFKLLDPPEGENSITWFRDSMCDLLKYILDTVKDSDQIGFIFNTPKLEYGPAWMSFRRADQINIDVVWDIFNNILQSNANIFTEGEFSVEMTQVSMPSGTGKLNGHGLKFSELCRRKHGIIEINNSDNLCLPRALIVGVAFINKDLNLKDIISDKNKLQTNRTSELLNNTGIRISPQGAGLDELRHFQNYFKQYNIVVYEYNGKGKVVFQGVKDVNLPRINLLYHQYHFNVIKSLTATFSCSYFCEPCHKPYNILGKHKCENICPLCFKSPVCTFIDVPNQILCKLCNRRFRGQNCFNNHSSSSICSKVHFCSKCFQNFSFKNKKPHICGEIFCKLCDEYKPPNHKCYIRIDKKQLDVKKQELFVYYDFETVQEKKIDDKNNLHEVNLCVIQQSCAACCDNNNELQKICYRCGTRQHIFIQDPVANFLQYILLPRTSFSKINCIAHNAKSFDAQFILKYLVETMNIKPKIICNGTKILLLEINNKIRFIDSINYFMMPLAALPKAMDLESSCKKGYFPHYFNTSANKNYVGPLPDIQYYGADSMNINVRKDFIKWHTQQTENKVIFEMSKEIIEYCISDVDILRRACEKFRKMFIENCCVDPFSEAVTIASSCNKVFRRLYLKPNTIGIIPVNGYRLSDKQSAIGLKWLINEEITRGIYISHAGHGKEIILKHNLKVDGYYEPDKLVFEFHGCFWHGCESCFRTKRDVPIFNNSKDTLNTRFYSTIEKSRKLRELGYTVIEIFECSFRDTLKSDKLLAQTLENHPLLNNLALIPRDAFFGGRTGNIYLYKKAEKDEKIKYVDYCSLYPFVCKYGKYPVGHPEIFVGDECKTILGQDYNIDQVEGLIKCKVLPPTALYHPVLPRKVHGKLMFSLCRSCCDELNQQDCVHTEEEREFVGTWVIDEVRRAVKLGYKIIYVYEIYKYEVTIYNRESKSGGLFVNYINEFLKIKQEASGYPAECITEADKVEYIRQYEEKEGISLDKNNITKNAGRRSVAKLALNSFWGKFAQSENPSKTSTVSTAEELYDLLSNPSVIVNKIIPAGDSMLYINWKSQSEATDQLSTVNVVIAAYTTAQARLRLYDLLESLGRRILYYDTDSIIYTKKPFENEPAVGNFLGDLTDELADYGPGSYISEFVCGGPKNYAYKVNCVPSEEIKYVCKIKGFRLNYQTSKILNFNTIKNLILNSEKNITQKVESYNIRTTADHSVVTRKENKTYKINFMKRRMVAEYESVPYGFVKKQKQQ